jgi:hypothetical protein
VGRPYPFGAYLHLLKASIEVSLTLWSTPYFPRTTTSSYLKPFTKSNYRPILLSLKPSLLVLSSSVDEEVTNTARVPPLIIIPQNELDKVPAQLDPSTRVKDGRSSVADEIGGHDLVLRVLDDALVRTFSGSFDSGFDLFVGRGFLDAHDKVDDGYTQGGHTECEATTYEIQDKRK